MATFIDERNETPELEEGEELQNFEENSEEEQPQEEQVTEPEAKEEEESLPEKYQGKSVKDIIAMHQNAEQLLGKQGQEVGELRKIVDDFINSQTVSNNAHSEQEFNEEDFFTNPKDAVQKLVESHPSIQQSRQLAEQLKKQEALAQLKSAHPDFNEVISNPKFMEWVAKSKVRTRLLKEADSSYDFDSADELFTLWKERQDTVKSTVEAEKIQRKEQVRTASSGTSQGSGERQSRKIYRRSDIIELMQKDPQRYEALLPEIRKAYAEKRVK
jgi:hypothetical protein